MFSVIIPVFNAANTLEEALISLQIQTCTDWEVVVVNDGATDKSMQVLKATTKEWNNVMLIEQENKGLGNARNVAANAAEGDWLVFLDADDYWAGNKLAVLKEFIELNKDPEVIYHPIMEKYANGLVRKRKFWPVNSIKELLTKGNPFVPSAMAIKKSTFLRHGGFIEERNQVEDLLFWFRLLKAKTNFGFVHRPLTVYRIGAGVTANLEDHLKKVFNAIAQALDEGFINTNEAEVFKQRKYYEAARQLQKMGNFKSALAYYNLQTKKGLKQNLLQSLCKLHIQI